MSLKFDGGCDGDGDGDGMCKRTLMGTDGLVRREVACLFADGDGDGTCNWTLMGTDGLVGREVECLSI